MGNQVGKGANRMAIAAMSNVTHVEKRELLSLQEKFKELATRDGNPNSINRAEFTEALSFVGINQNDSDIFDRLFTMYDKTGDDVILYREFLCGVSPLISGSPAEKIEFAFKMYDTDGKNVIRSNAMVNVLSNMNRVASYFGDPVMTEDQIQKCVDSVFELVDDIGPSVEIRYADYIKVIVEHPVVQTFIMGGGTVQYGMGR